MPTETKTRCPRTPPTKLAKENMISQSHQPATDIEKLKHYLRALTLQQRQIFSAKLRTCKGNKESIKMIGQLLNQFGIKLPSQTQLYKLEAKQRQPKSKTTVSNNIKLKQSRNTWWHPPPSTPKATTVEISQKPPELQTFNEEELVTKIKWSWKGTMIECERSILKRVRRRIKTAK